MSDIYVGTTFMRKTVALQNGSYNFLSPTKTKKKKIKISFESVHRGLLKSTARPGVFIVFRVRKVYIYIRDFRGKKIGRTSVLLHTGLNRLPFYPRTAVAAGTADPWFAEDEFAPRDPYTITRRPSTVEPGKKLWNLVCTVLESTPQWHIHTT